MDAAPIAITTPSPKRAGAWDCCPMSLVNSWSVAGPATCEVEWSWVCDLYYILLLPINKSLLAIITWPVITYYYCFCNNIVITLLLCIITSFIITYYYNFCYYTVITSLLHIITSFIIIFYYIFFYYTVITSLLHIATYSLLPIITTSLLRNITHYYIIITSLLLHYSQLQN